jgi:hypothetical protein
VDLLDLGVKLEMPAEVDQRAADVVELRFFEGLTIAEITDILAFQELPEVTSCHIDDGLNLRRKVFWASFDLQPRFL